MPRARRKPANPRKRRRNLRSAWLVAVAVAAGAGYWIWSRGWQPPRRPPQSPAPAYSRTSAPGIAPVEAFPTSATPPSTPVLPLPTNPPPARPSILVSTNLVRVRIPTNAFSSPLESSLPGSGGAEPVPPEGRPIRSYFEAQVALSHRGLSPGSMDGVPGGQTRAALRAFQSDQNLEPTGELDEPTRRRLLLLAPATDRYVITAEELATLRPVPSSWFGKSEATYLGYESPLELVAERYHSHPALIRKLNPGVDWDHVQPGQSFLVPAATVPESGAKAARIRISLGQKTLRAFDSSQRLIAHFPVSIAQRVEKRPVGELHVEVTVRDPNYTFDPEIFPESPEARSIGRKLILPPGPNNPVGIAWIGLDRPGYGIHGTPHPEAVGRTESHGCFRLANWNADHLRRLVTPGVPVLIEP